MALHYRVAALRRTLRLLVIVVLPLTLVLSVLAGAVLPLVTPLLLNWAQRDMDERARLVAKALEEPIASALQEDNRPALVRRLDKLTQDRQLLAVAICEGGNQPVVASTSYPKNFGCRGRPAIEPAREGNIYTRWLHGPDTHASHVMLTLTAAEPEGSLTDVMTRTGAPRRVELIVLHNPSYAWRRSEQTQRYLMWLIAGLGVLLAAMTYTWSHWYWRKWVDGVRRILHEGATDPVNRAPPEVQPLVPDIRRLLRSVHEDRRILKDTTIEWRPETLKLLLREHLFGDEVIVVSNREPYIHQRQADGSIRVQRPASGLVTAVEPVMRACSGVWVAHGSGSADADVVDAKSRVRVPPQLPGEEPVQGSYTLRRVWLSEEEERGYYFGFANEGLWPLCHIAHVRPVFREEDWKQYQAVNARFADAVVAEARTDNPVVLVQDYHFALLPKMLRERLPRATILTFWHIPWPNAESFGICPWAREIVEGLLGSSILGFHTRYHCENFLQTVDRFLESRITREDASIAFQGHRTKVRDYPISIHFDPPTPGADSRCDLARRAVRQRYGLPPDQHVAIGVDRLDYTKGIVERLLAVERMLDTHPSWRGRFTMIQIAAPTRSTLEEYRRLDAEVRAQTRRINEKFAQLDPAAPPAVIMLIEQHDAASVQEHYRASDVALVTSLHDGMNLVAKEYIAACETEDGVLIVSRFAGAAAELHEALVVNPYHVGQTADALARALAMPPAERRERMRAMRTRLADFNIYRWAGRMLLDAADERQRERVQDRIVRISEAAAPRHLLRPWRRRAVEPQTSGDRDELPPRQARRA